MGRCTYAIMQAVGQSAGPSFPAGPGTIYGSLQRMEEDGLVREMPSRGDDRRRLFVLQPDGRRALETESRRILRLAQLVRAKRLVSGEHDRRSPPSRVVPDLSGPAPRLPASIPAPVRRRHGQRLRGHSRGARRAARGVSPPAI